MSDLRIRTIGLVGCGRGVGTSHLAISLANYLTGVKRKKTAILEWNSHGDFSRIERFAGKHSGRHKTIQQETDPGRKVFCLMDVDYYKMADPSVLAFCLGQDYRYVILDHGEASQSSLCECVRCDLKILVGSLNEWKAEGFLEILEQAESMDKSWKLAIMSGGEETRREVEKLFRCRLQKFPASVDAFRITPEKIKCFEKLLLGTSM